MKWLHFFLLHFSVMAPIYIQKLIGNFSQIQMSTIIHFLYAYNPIQLG